MKESSLVKRYARALVLAVDSEEELGRVRANWTFFCSCWPATTGCVWG